MKNHFSFSHFLIFSFCFTTLSSCKTIKEIPYLQNSDEYMAAQNGQYSSNLSVGEQLANPGSTDSDISHQTSDMDSSPALSVYDMATSSDSTESAISHQPSANKVNSSISPLPSSIASSNAQQFEMRIKPKDQLLITVHSQDQNAVAHFNLINPRSLNLNSSRVTGRSELNYYTVDNNGEIDYPVVGKINLQGLSIEQASEKIKEAIKPYFSEDANNLVTTKIINYYISVMGEVKSPNSFNVQSNKVNVLEALAMAGDLTIYGVRTNVKLLREQADGKYEIHKLDLTDANILNSPYYYMQQRDILYVEPNPVKAEDRKIGQTTRLWVRGASVSLALGSLLYMVLK